MDEVKSYAIMLCFAAAAAGIAKSLVPSQKFDGVMKLVIGAFVLCALISPLQNIVQKIPEMSEISFRETPAEPQGQTEILLEKELEKKITGFFLDMGIELNNVRVDVNINDDRVIIVDSHSISIDKGYKSREEEIISGFEKSFGFSPVIIYE